MLGEKQLDAYLKSLEEKEVKHETILDELNETMKQLSKVINDVTVLTALNNTPAQQADEIEEKEEEKEL